MLIKLFPTKLCQHTGYNTSQKTKRLGHKSGLIWGNGGGGVANDLEAAEGLVAGLKLPEKLRVRVCVYECVGSKIAG